MKKLLMSVAVFVVIVSAGLFLVTNSALAETETTGILNRAIEQGKLYQAKQNKVIESLKDRLRALNIYCIPYHKTRVTEDEVILFLSKLLVDTESQKIFQKFTASGVTIWLSDCYEVDNFGGVEVNIKDGVKKVAKWLSQ